MAIAFFVDPEYGPLPGSVQPIAAARQQSNSTSPQSLSRRNRRQVTVEIDENNNHVIPDLVHGVATFPQLGLGHQPPVVTHSQRRQLSPPVTVPSPQSSWTNWLQLLCTMFTRTTETPSGHLQAGENESLQDELPDVVQCHHGFSLDLSFESSRTVGPRPAVATEGEDLAPRRRCRRPAGSHHTVPLSTFNPEPSPYVMDPDIMNEWNVELKVAVTSWKQVGAELRQIGDQYAFEIESSIQHQQTPSRESLQVRCVFRLATLPALAVVGLVTGLAYLRRHL